MRTLQGSGAAGGYRWWRRGHPPGLQAGAEIAASICGKTLVLQMTTAGTAVQAWSAHMLQGIETSNRCQLSLLFNLQGVVAVLSGGTINVLCHAAVRARNTSVLLAACCNAAELAALRELEGQLVAVGAVGAATCAKKVSF